MKNFARIGQPAQLLGVLLLFLAILAPVDAATKKSVAPKKAPAPNADPLAVVVKAEMLDDREKAVDEFYEFPASLDKKLASLGMIKEQFAMLVTAGLNRPPEKPQRVIVLRKYTIDRSTVAVWYRAVYLARYEGSRDDLHVLKKTDDGWKIDPTFSWWFVDQRCLYPRINKTCTESQKMFRGKNGENRKVIGERILKWQTALAKALAIEAEAEAAAQAENESPRDDEGESVESGG